MNTSRKEWLQSKLGGVGEMNHLTRRTTKLSQKLSFTMPAGRLVAIVIHTVSKATGSPTAGGWALLFFF